MRENKEAALLWRLSSTQWRVGVNGATGLDYNAVYIIAETYGIDITPGIMSKILALECAQLTKLSKGGDK